MSSNATGRPEPRLPLDAVDRALLEEVARDGRATYENLARAVGLSRPAVRARLNRLLSSGVVRVTGVIHPSVFGLNAYAHIAVAVDGPALPVARLIAEHEDAPFVSMVGGRFPLVAELRSQSRETLEATVRRIAALAGVRRVESTLYTAILKDAHYPPGVFNAVPLDDIDRRLLSHLQRDGRASFADMGEAVGLSVSAARTRVLRLLEAGAVHVGARIDPQAAGTAQHLGFELALGAGAAESISRIRRMPQVAYLATCIGRCDAVGTAAAGTSAELLDTLETMRSIPGVQVVESWPHQHTVKLSYERSPTATAAPAVSAATSQRP